MRTRFALGAISAASALGLAGVAFAGPPILQAPPPANRAPAAAPSAKAPAPAAPSAAALGQVPSAAAPGAAPSGAPGAAPSGAPGAVPPAAPGAEKHKPWEHLTKLDERLDALRKEVAERKKTLTERREAEQERDRLRWGAIVTSPAVREELRLHAMRSARLQRIQELAEVEGKKTTEARVNKLIQREDTRHEKRMAALATGGAQ